MPNTSNAIASCRWRSSAISATSRPGPIRRMRWSARSAAPCGPAAAHDHAEHATHRAIHLQYAGCYDEVVVGPAVDRNGLHYIEYFGARAKVADTALAAHFQARAGRHPAATLNFVLRRIGQLGPDPGNLSVWTFASYDALEPFARASLDDDPFRPTDVGVYRWFGKEIL